MQDRRKRNLRRRRKKIFFTAILCGLLMAAAVLGVFYGVMVLLGGKHWSMPVTLPENISFSGIEAFFAGWNAPPEHEQLPLGQSETAGSMESDTEVVGSAETAGSTETAGSAKITGGAESSTESAGGMESGAEGDAETADSTEASDSTELAEEDEAPQTAEPAAREVSVAAAPEPVYIKLVAVGDNLMHRSVSMSGLKADGSYNYDYNFSKVAPIIQAADLAVINQETVIGGNELGIQGYPCFNGRTEMADALVRNGFDVILGANNHILDQGAQGVLHMVQYFQTNYPQIALLGIHGSWETRDEVKIVTCKGIRIGMINYTDLLNIPSNWYGQEYLTDYLDYDRLAALIRQAKANSDFVIVFPHWGTEYNLGIDAKQQEEVSFLAQQGVDLVIGTHPHVVEPVSYITRPDGGRMLVYYSLGNYQSIQNKEETMIGAMAEVEICKTFAGVKISNFNMRFLANDYRMSGGLRDYYDIVTTYPWEQYSRDLADTSWVHHDNPAFNVDYMFQLEAQMQAQVTAERQAAGLE